MTRINVGIDPRDLTQQHLLAEHREIKRIPNVIASGRYNLNMLPEVFTLGTGHVRFFYNKLGYLLKRYDRIYKECIARGFNVQPYHEAWQQGQPEELLQDWEPTAEARALIVGRLIEKLVTSDEGEVWLRKMASRSWIKAANERFRYTHFAESFAHIAELCDANTLGDLPTFNDHPLIDVTFMNRIIGRIDIDLAIARRKFVNAVKENYRG